MAEMGVKSAKTPKGGTKKQAPVPSKAKADLSSSLETPVEQVLQLQRTIGNHAVAQLFQTGAIQAKLQNGQPFLQRQSEYSGTSFNWGRLLVAPGERSEGKITAVYSMGMAIKALYGSGVIKSTADLNYVLEMVRKRNLHEGEIVWNRLSPTRVFLLPSRIQVKLALMEREAAGAENIPVGEHEEWSTWKTIEYLTGLSSIGDFKDQWVHAHRNVIIQAAARYDIPAYLLGAIAWSEVGGDPDWADDAKLLFLENICEYDDPDNISWGNVSIQLRRAAAAYNINVEDLTDEEKSSIIKLIKSSNSNIFIVAAHLNDLRNVDFRGVSADSLTEEQIKVIGTRYWYGPEASIEFIRRKIAEDPNAYGNTVIRKRERILNLLG